MDTCAVISIALLYTFVISCQCVQFYNERHVYVQKIVFKRYLFTICYVLKVYNNPPNITPTKTTSKINSLILLFSTDLPAPLCPGVAAAGVGASKEIVIIRVEIVVLRALSDEPEPIEPNEMALFD